ncbi:MAG: response regulator [Hahellaceae bacterium]|nr:response regulator [Hahellaceae bacterium]MCP5210693.1 response regulator [Hahellaceae bacterium]
MNKPYILCVDDDKTILMSLKAQLKYCLGTAFNYEVAESAAEAWEVINDVVAEGKTIAVVVSDWLMPETKGDEFLISVHVKHPEIIKIMLTGHADEDAVIRAQEQANLAACLTKPWTKEELVEIIQNALGAQ